VALRRKIPTNQLRKFHLVVAMYNNHKTLDRPNIAQSTMPNFSTKDMKAAVYCTDADIERLPDESVDQMKELFTWLFPKKENFLVVLAFAGHYLHKDDAMELKPLMDQQKVSIISQTESVMVLQTKKGYTITSSHCW